MAQTYTSRIKNHKNDVAQRLLTLMDEKQTNLCVSVDLTSSLEVLRLARLVGPYICLLKTHVDILEDFTQDFTRELQEIAKEHNFLIFEDRKFADIGNTVSLQYSKGIYEIANWADITNCHTIAGEGTIMGLEKVGLPKGRALLLLAEMSSKGNLFTDSYRDRTIELADAHEDFVIGFIAMAKPNTTKRDYIIMTPGVNLTSKGDSLGQQYKTPYNVVKDMQTDIIIVGRGIYGESNDEETTKLLAQKYKEEGWKGYLDRLSS